MRVSKEFVGKVVSIQVGRPLYIIDYAAHLKFPDKPQTRMAGEPVMQGEKPVVMDILLAVEVIEVLDDNLTVQMVTPGENLVRKTIPTALIMSIDEVVAFEAENLPDVTKRVRQPATGAAPTGKLIL